MDATDSVEATNAAADADPPDGQLNQQPEQQPERQGPTSLGDYATLLTTLDGATASITLNRPDVRNAMNAAMVSDLLRCFRTLRDEEAYAGVRVVILRASGVSFSAGSDVHELAAHPSRDDGIHAGEELDDLLRTVNEAPQVVIARIQGHALGGGLGLICVSDIAVAGYSARFGLPETRLGLAPAVIMPYVIQRIGLTTARRLLLTGGLMGPDRAQQYGIVQEVCADMELDARVGAVVSEVMRCAPRALRAAKEMLFRAARDGDTRDDRVTLLYELSQTEEAQQGLQSFTEKTLPPWAPEQ